MAQVHQKERELTREVSNTVEQGLLGVEVLAVELSGPESSTASTSTPGSPCSTVCETSWVSCRSLS